MSAQAGAFRFDGGPVAPDVASRFGTALAPFGSDRAGEYASRDLVMVSRALHVTPEDAAERQPIVSRRGNVMTWDGRLDNRDDLLLLVRRELAHDHSDVALAMAVFERWGVEGFRRLIGDWSLAVWEAAARTLHLASDYMGVRGLYYRADRQGVQWSSTLSVLVRPRSAASRTSIRASWWAS